MAIGAALVAGGLTAGGMYGYSQSRKDWSDRSALGKALSPSISGTDVGEAFEGYKEELATAQEQEAQGLSEAQLEQGIGAGTAAAGKVIASQLAAEDTGAVGDENAQSLKRKEMILEGGAETIAETTAGTTAQMMGLSEEIEAADAERIAAEEQRLLSNLLAYRQSRGNFINRLFGTAGKTATVLAPTDAA